MFGGPTTCRWKLLWKPSSNVDVEWKDGLSIMDETMFLNLVKTTAENHGCTLVDVDLENHVINLDGPDEAVANCARAIADLVGD